MIQQICDSLGTPPGSCTSFSHLQSGLTPPRRGFINTTLSPHLCSHRPAPSPSAEPNWPCPHCVVTVLPPLPGDRMTFQWSSGKAPLSSLLSVCDASLSPEAHICLLQYYSSTFCKKSQSDLQKQTLEGFYASTKGQRHCGAIFKELGRSELPFHFSSVSAPQ